MRRLNYCKMTRHGRHGPVSPSRKLAWHFPKDLIELIRAIAEGLQQHRVELAARSLRHHLHGGGVRQGGFISATRAQTVVNVGDRQNSGRQRDVAALWVPKTSSADRIDAKRAGERRLAERRRTRPGREFCLVQMEIAIRIRSSFSRPDAPYHRCDDSPCDGRQRAYATRV